MSNQVTLVGYISSDFTYDHEILGEKFYKTYVSVKRASGTTDVIPVLISERIINVKNDYTGQYVHIEGQFRSHNKHEENKTRLLLYVFAFSVELLDRQAHVNDLILEGAICKQPTYRMTPQGREIADIMLAVSKGYGKSDYIPCLAWGRNAGYAASMDTGTKIRLTGRVQSREYSKCGEIKTAYEVSVSLLEVV